MVNTKLNRMPVDVPATSRCSKVTARDSSNAFSEKKIVKNLLVVSVAFLILFTAFQSLANLQTSLNMRGGVGSGSLAIIYAAMILSCLFVPPVMIARIGCKWTMPISIIGYILYMAANFYPVWSLMAPAAVLIGFGGAPLWAAKCTYLTQIAVWYARHTGKSQDAVINAFFGVFFMIFQTCQIWGNLISSTIFSHRGANKTVDNSPEVLALCGAKFCPTSLNISGAVNLERPVETRVYIVCGIYTVCACTAALVIVFLLDRIQLEKNDTKSEEKDADVSLLIATLRHLKQSRYQQLLVPLTIYSGVEQAFIGGDFTRSYVTCSLGIWNVGYVMICYGVVDAICSLLFGRLVQNVGHVPFFVLAIFVHGACQIALMLWIPSPDTIVLYVIAASWGLGDAVFQTQFNALYGQLFSDNTEAAFANFRLWQSVGFIGTYTYNDWLCTDVKLYICLVVMCVGILGYGTTEALFRRHGKMTRAKEVDAYASCGTFHRQLFAIDSHPRHDRRRFRGRSNYVSLAFQENQQSTAANNLPNSPPHSHLVWNPVTAQDADTRC